MGRLLLWGGGFFAVYSVLQINGVSGAVSFWVALAAVVLLGLALWAWRLRRLRAIYAEAAQLHKHVHELEQNVKAMEIAEARRNGDLDRFEGKT